MCECCNLYTEGTQDKQLTNIPCFYPSRQIHAERVLFYKSTVFAVENSDIGVIFNTFTTQNDYIFQGRRKSYGTIKYRVIYYTVYFLNRGQKSALELSPKGHISSEPEVVIIWFLKTHKEMCLMRQCTAKTILNNGPFVSSAALILLNSVFSGRAVDFLS